MRPFTSMKVGLASILSCLALFLGLFATMGTASAHTVGPQVDPHIRVAFVINRGNDCTSFLLVGNGFSRNHTARLFANIPNGFGVRSISPRFVHIDGEGDFDSDVTVCSNFSRFGGCGEFVESPNFFCGFNFNPQDFCSFGFESSQFCFPGEGFPPPFCHPTPFMSCPQLHSRCELFQCGFHPVRVADFCRFRASFGFCRFNRSLTAFVTAEDLHTEVFSNTVGVRIFRVNIFA